MSEAEEKQYYEFEATITESREKDLDITVITPDKYKGLRLWLAKSLTRNLEISDNFVKGEVRSWVFSKKKGEKAGAITGAQIGSPNNINLVFDTSGIATQLSGVASQIIDIKEFLKVDLLERLDTIVSLLKPKTKKAKPKTEPTEVHK